VSERVRRSGSEVLIATSAHTRANFFGRICVLSLLLREVVRSLSSPPHHAPLLGSTSGLRAAARIKLGEGRSGRSKSDKAM
jgi:hypothetical protein